MSLWAMLAAPLLAGNDLRSMTPEILAILTNKEVIAVDQDKLGKQGQRAWQSGEQEVWTRQLNGNAMAIAIFNRAKDEAKIAVKPADIKITGTWKARDVWTHKAVPRPAEGENAFTYASAGVVVLRLRG